MTGVQALIIKKTAKLIFLLVLISITGCETIHTTTQAKNLEPQNRVCMQFDPPTSDIEVYTINGEKIAGAYDIYYFSPGDTSIILRGVRQSWLAQDPVILRFQAKPGKNYMVRWKKTDELGSWEARIVDDGPSTQADVEI